MTIVSQRYGKGAGTMADFNELEQKFLRFLKAEYLQKGSKPKTMLDPGTRHRDVMSKFNLELPAYREIVGRFEALGIVEAPTIEAANGCLHIDPVVVEVVRQLDNLSSSDADRGVIQPADDTMGWISIRLSQGQWQYNPSAQLGDAGGFGTVFEGRAEGYESLAIKELKLERHDVSHREMDLAGRFVGRSFEHVIPFLDAGKDQIGGGYFVVMPRAEKRLYDEIGHHSEHESAEIIMQIAKGLSEVPDIVHRDLKPKNILFHDGKWKIADFGIARLVEESTSSQTLKRFKSEKYAAPEQWLEERATRATDVYALGCIACELLTGSPPFSVGGRHGFKHCHLREAPPSLNIHSAQLETLVLQMLRKQKESRPSVERICERLAEILESDRKTPQPGLNQLAKVGAEAAKVGSIVDAELASATNEHERRQELAKGAFEILKAECVERLFKAVADNVPTARRGQNTTSHREHVEIGNARLQVNYLNDMNPFPTNCFPKSGWDVVAGGTIRVFQQKPEYVWGASLWYTNCGQGEEFRWYEVSYFRNPLAGTQSEFEPFFLSASDADRAAGRAMDVFQVAFGPQPIDDEAVDAFIDRWAERLALAYRGDLREPRSLPIRN